MSPEGSDRLADLKAPRWVNVALVVACWLILAGVLLAAGVVAVSGCQTGASLHASASFLPEASARMSCP
jgi:hypothetical protein